MSDKTMDPYFIGHAYARLCLIRDTIRDGAAVMGMLLEQKDVDVYEAIGKEADKLIGRLMDESDKLREFVSKERVA
jgi:hypothetical protein